MRLNKAQRNKARRNKRQAKKEIQAKRQALKKQIAEQKIFGYREPSKWVQMPDIFPPDTPTAKRREIIAEIIKKAKGDFATTFPDLQKWFSEFDSCYLLSFYAFYFMSQKMGTTSEHEGDFEHYQHYLEILHAIALTKERNISAQPLLDRATELEEQMSKLGTLMQFKLMDDISEDDSDEIIQRKGFITQVRTSTAAVRNWAYHFQMVQVTTELMSTIDREYYEEYGITASDFAHALLDIPMMINSKFQDHIGKIRKVYAQKNLQDVTRAYAEVFPDVQMDEEKSTELFKSMGKSLKQFKTSLILHSDLRLQDIFTFSVDELISSCGKELSRDHLLTLLDSLSYNFGDLRDQNIDHILLDNPVLKKPLIKLEEGVYFCPIAGALAHFGIPIIENTIQAKSSLTDKYAKRKSAYCEDYVKSVLTKNFPNATHYQNIKWQHEDIPNKVFESDNILLAESFALIVESKSGKLSPQGRRGAEDRLQRHVDELVLEPSRQANNFIDAVKSGKLKNVKDSNGRSINIDFSEIRYFIPISITLENLGTMSDARSVMKAGMNKELRAQDISLCMTMTDLDCVFQILPYEAMKLHYLVRRREFGLHLDFMGDEMDLLQFYLDKGFNIGESEYKGDIHMNLSMLSANIDKYFMLLDDQPINPPSSFLTEEWANLIESLAKRKPNGWIEASFALLNCDNDDQVKFNTNANKLVLDVRKNNLSKYPKNPYMLFSTGAPERRTAILFYAYRNLSREERNDTITDIMSSKELDSCKIKLAFGVDVDKPRQLYGVMAVSKDSKLAEEPPIFISKNNIDS